MSDRNENEKSGASSHRGENTGKGFVNENDQPAERHTVREYIRNQLVAGEINTRDVMERFKLNQGDHGKIEYMIIRIKNARKKICEGLFR